MVRLARSCSPSLPKPAAENQFIRVKKKKKKRLNFGAKKNQRGQTEMKQWSRAVEGGCAEENMLASAIFRAAARKDKHDIIRIIKMSRTKGQQC